MVLDLLQRRSPLPLAWGILMLVSGVCWGQPQTMEIFALKYRTTDQLMPMIRPLVPAPGTVTGLQNQLIVRSTPQNLAEIRMVLERVDTLPRRLLITVRQDAALADSTADASVSGSVSLGRSGDLSVGAPGGRGVDVQILDSRRARADRGTQQIQVLEGQSAFIQSGESVPVLSREVIRGPGVRGPGGGGADGRGPGGVVVIDSIDYRSTATGFEVLARLSGDRVVLDIRPQREVAGRAGPGSVDSQRLSTTVSGRLGEWIDLGGASRSVEGEQSVLLGRTTGREIDQRRVQVRVEELR